MLIVDSGCDQGVVALASCITLNRLQKYCTLAGALMGDRMISQEPLELCNVATKATFADGRTCILILNQFMLDENPSQTESLLNPHQARANEVLLDDTAVTHKRVDGNFGTQRFVVDNISFPLHFDGYKMYISICKPTHTEYDTLPRYTLTADTPFEPQLGRIYSRRMQTPGPLTVEDWRANLGYPTREVTQQTIKNTTQLIRSVEAETRESMRDHYAARLHPLRPHRINDTCYTDTFFCVKRSIRGHTCWQLFALKECCHDTVYLMRTKSQVPTQLEDYAREVGVPNIMIHDGAKEVSSKKWLDLIRRYIIAERVSEPHHQNQNLAERRGGDIKRAFEKLFHETGADIRYW